MKSKSDPDFSLVLACYNEEAHLENSIDEIINTLDLSIYSYELVLVDDKSTDDTRKIIKKIENKYNNHAITSIFHQKNTGRGGAVTTGIKKTRADIVGYIDVDLEVKPLYIPYCVKKVEDGEDMVIGMRVYKIQINGFFRYLTHWVYLQLVRLLIGVKFLQDTETGYKFFRKKKVLPILNKCRNKHWFWSTEFVAYSFIHGLNFYQVPCLYIRNQHKKTTVKVVRDSWQYFISLVKFYFREKEALRKRRREIKKQS